MKTLVMILKLLAGRGLDYKVSVTGEDEILVARQQKDGTWINLIVDEEGDIELMRIPTDWSKSENKLYHSPTKGDIVEITDLFATDTNK